MNRKETPDILSNIIPVAGEEQAEIIAGLRWDYSQAEDPEAVRRIAVDFVRGARMTAKGTWQMADGLTRMKDQLPHGQWLSWLKTDGQGIGEDTARKLMAIRREFPNPDTCPDLPYSIMRLLPGKSAETQRAVIEAADNGRVTVKRAQEIIDQHKPGAFGGGPDAGHRKARCRNCGRELTDDESIARGLGPCCARKPAVLTYERDEDSQVDPDDDPRLWKIPQLIDELRSCRSMADRFGDITGKHTETLAFIRESEKLIAKLRRELSYIDNSVVMQWEDVAAGEGWE